MARRYTAEALLLLRQSPLCVKPANLPPAEQWMGHPADPVRTQPSRPTAERAKTNDSTFTLDQTRRPVGDRHNLRSASNSEDLAVGPPKVGFTSTSLRSLGAKFGGDGEKPFRDQESRDRFGLRTRSDQPDSTNHSVGGGYANNTSRDTRNPAYRRRGDGEQDNEGWSTVKPRHSFGHDGAERFHGRMGGSGSNSNHERFARDDRKPPRDRDDGDFTGRNPTRRTFDRDTGRDGDDNADGARRNGLAGRGPWFKDSNGGTGDERSERLERSDRSERPERPNFGDRNDRPSQRDRISQAKNWRERDTTNQSLEPLRDRNNDLGGNSYDRRWDRDRDRDRDYYQQQQRVERDPEWMDEDITFADDNPSAGGHTAEDLRRFMEEMKGLRSGASAEAPADASSSGNGSGKAVTIEASRDRFFEQYAKPSNTEDGDTGGPGDVAKEAKAKSGKSSRFTSFFSTQQEDTRRQIETPAQAATNAPPQSPPNVGGIPGLPGMADAAEKEAFQVLLQKLQRQTISGGGDGPANSGSSPAAVGGFSRGSVGLGGPVASNSSNNSNANKNSAPLPSIGAYQGSPNGTGLSTPHERQAKSGIASPEPAHLQSQIQSGTDHRDESRFRPGMPPTPAQQGIQETLIQHQQRPGQSPPSAVLPEQVLQELLIQRQRAASQEAGPSRMGPSAGGPNANMAMSNQQTEFLMKLMQGHNGPEGRNMSLGPEDMFMQRPQSQKQANGPPVPDREAEMAEIAARERERMGLPRQHMRLPQGPPGLFPEEQFHRQDVENRPPQQQPTQILQRAPPPGLEHTMHGPPPPAPPPAFLQQQQQFLQQQQQQQQGAGGGGGRMPPQQAPPRGSQQPMIPPPGLGMVGPNMPPGIPGMPPMQNIPPMLNMHMPPNMLNMPPNMSNMSNMPNMPPPMPNMPPVPGMMFPPNFSPNGPFPPDGPPTGPPRGMHAPPPGFYNGPPGPPGFMPPLGMGFQGPPPPLEGMPFPYDGRGMGPQQPPPPPGIGGYRRA